MKYFRVQPSPHRVPQSWRDRAQSSDRHGWQLPAKWTCQHWASQPRQHGGYHVINSCFLVPLIGGRWYISPQLAVYTAYIYHLYIAYWVIIYITYHLFREPETAVDVSVLGSQPCYPPVPKWHWGEYGVPRNSSLFFRMSWDGWICFSLKKNNHWGLWIWGLKDSWEIASRYFWHMVQVFSMECEEDQSLIHQAYVADSFTVRTIKIHW